MTFYLQNYSMYVVCGIACDPNYMNLKEQIGKALSEQLKGSKCVKRSLIGQGKALNTKARLYGRVTRSRSD